MDTANQPLESNTGAGSIAPTVETTASPSLLRRLWGGGLVVVGYLLSPLCWWNDLAINLPLALAFGYLTSRPFPGAMVPLTVLGYWLTNVVGFMLMQQGAITALKKSGASSNQAWRHGLITSTLYTLAIALLLQLHLIETPDFLQDDLLAQLHTWLPGWLQG
ncbi:MAG: hypothetical protein ACOYMP_13275 [Nodosilinea sp.]